MSKPKTEGTNVHLAITTTCGSRGFSAYTRTVVSRTASRCQEPTRSAREASAVAVRGMSARCPPGCSEPDVTMNDLLMKVIVLVSSVQSDRLSWMRRTKSMMIGSRFLVHNPLSYSETDGRWVCCYLLRNRKTDGMFRLGLRQTKSQCGEPQWEIEWDVMSQTHVTINKCTFLNMHIGICYVSTQLKSHSN